MATKLSKQQAKAVFGLSLIIIFFLSLQSLCPSFPGVWCIESFHICHLCGDYFSEGGSTDLVTPFWMEVEVLLESVFLVCFS